jgi:hypothetical protein
MEQIIRPFVATDGVISHYVLTGRGISERVLAIRQLAQQTTTHRLLDTPRCLFPVSTHLKRSYGWVHNQISNKYWIRGV